jgi:hypothetical protein
MPATLLPENPSFGTQLARNLGGGISRGLTNAQEFAQRIALEKEKQKGRKNMYSEVMKEQQLSSALNTISNMQDLLRRNNVGTKFGFNLSPWKNTGEEGRDRGEFEKLGQSLIPVVAAGVSIRNQKEFEEYKKIITDPDAPRAKIEGALSGLQRMVQERLGSEEEMVANGSPEKEKHEGFVMMETPSGTKKRVPRDKVKEFIARGGKRIE